MQLPAQGAEVHGFRLWSRLYPATGREGYVLVAFIVHRTLGRMAAQRESRMRSLEQAARPLFAGVPYQGGGEGVTAVDDHRALPETLDNPDGDRLYAIQLNGPSAPYRVRGRRAGSAAARVRRLRETVQRRPLAAGPDPWAARGAGPPVRTVRAGGPRPRRSRTPRPPPGGGSLRPRGGRRHDEEEPRPVR
ncbi:hypothetical protein CRV15_28965 (plasmid) [Streptomyces clavuligerus]|uniref:Uncharacterized protein n=1 Tax=Streptomyces clavuligerus TaxID=1901 RepID=B5GUF2_STRCL|nr:hypothetical protein SSCG_03202 [Streptomyces clavuligerus]EFG03665.1 Hypothetical protein SCLAV_p0174 [Streptomyces clavuligerus]QCS10882.1 hypothetical protein CRV15_28965 [Streptomyces clavuligerus]QPJ98285.1 hypothetical protein GE265_35395 [Streptomyces clavuligerus]